MSRLYRVTLDYYCCGFMVEDGKIIESAPIMSWAIGKSLEAYQNWVIRKGGTVESVDE